MSNHDDTGQGFEPEWLRLREPLDRAARDAGLAREFAGSIPAPPDGVRRIVDLAAGTGANFRALAPVVDSDQDWTLVDHDPRLLAGQVRAIARWALDAGWRVDASVDACLIDTGRARWHVRGLAVDLALDLERLRLEEFDAVTCAAFLDLVSGEWIERLCAWLATSPRPLLAVLTVDGRRAWTPAARRDADVNAAFASHQRGDKGFGPALGGAALAHLARYLPGNGFEVRRARSDWAVDARHGDVLATLLEEAVEIARGPVAGRWAATRRRQLARGRLSLHVGHEDLLAIPAGRGPGRAASAPVS